MPAPPPSEPLLACSLDFAFAGGSGPRSSGSGRAELDRERLALLPASGPPTLVPLIEITAIAADGPTLRLTLNSTDSLALQRLGAAADDFLQALTNAWYEALLDAHGLREAQAGPAFQAALVIQAGAARPCEIRLLETALVILRPDSDPVRLPYALLDSVHTEGHQVTVSARWKGPWTFARLGRSLEPFLDALAAASNALHAAHLDSVRRALPDLDPAVLRAASGLLRDGLAAPVPDLRASGLWPSIERAAAAAGAADEWAVLREMGDMEGWRAGIKRGLAGSLSGDYLFLLAPLPGPSAALESVRLDRDGREPENRATYAFRLEGETGPALDGLNRDLLELNFRREPLLQPAGGLSRRRPAALDALRSRFLGRAVHRSPEGWKRDLLELIAPKGGT